MKLKIILIAVFGILILANAAADILSINSGGSNNFIINPQQFLEGFFLDANRFPVVSNVLLNSSSLGDTTNENLSVYYSNSDADNDNLTNILDWRVDGDSINVLNLPFNKRVYTGEVRDYSSFENGGVLGGGVSSAEPSWQEDCVVGGCYNFDGSGDYVNVSSSSSLDIENEITISAWIKVDSWTTNYWEGTIVGKDDWFDGNSHGYVLRVGQSGRLSFTIGKDNSPDWPEALSGSLMSAGNWYHVVGTFNGTHLKIYIDRDLKVTTVVSQTLMETSTYDVKVGQSPFAPSRAFNGSIDEVKIYNRSLSPEQIDYIYQRGSAGLPIDKFVLQETTKGEVWKVGITPNDAFNDGETVFSNELTIVDASPLDPDPELVSIDLSNESDADLNCSSVVQDVDNSLLDITVNWLKENVSQMNLSYFSQANGSLFSSILDEGNLTLGDIWKCQMRVNDGNSNSDWIESNELVIIDTTSPEIYIVSPEDINYTTIFVNMNISIVENENISWCGYSVDFDPNVTMNRLNDSYFWDIPTTLGPGGHEVVFTCNDTSGNYNTNSTDFYIDNEAAIAILLSENLSNGVLWELTTIPVTDEDAVGNNESGVTTYFVNISVTNTLADLYVRADGDLLTQALDEIGLGNETFMVNVTEDPTVSVGDLKTMNTTYVLVADQLGDGDIVYLKFFLDAQAGQAAGAYLNALDFKAVKQGQSPGI
jgi:hypothetical protein